MKIAKASQKCLELLFRIFQDCVGPDLQCAIIYYKTPGLEARFSLTDEIVRSVLPKKRPGGHDHPSVKVWDNAIKVRHDLLSMRRRIEDARSLRSIALRWSSLTIALPPRL